MKQSREQALLAGLLVVFAIATRVIFNWLHVYNFSAIMAAGLFAGAYLGSKRIGILIPLIAMLATDVALGVYQWQVFPATHPSLLRAICYDPKLMAVIYASLLAAVFIGKFYAKNSTLLRFTGSVLGGSLLFFLVTNAAVWLFGDGTFYPHTWSGLMQSYTMGLPFYRNTLLSDITWSSVLFGSYELMRLRVRVPKAATSVA